MRDACSHDVLQLHKDMNDRGATFAEDAIASCFIREDGRTLDSRCAGE